MFRRILFLIDAVRALRASGRSRGRVGGDPRMAMVLKAIEAWRGSRRGSGARRSGGTLSMLMDAFRALKSSRTPGAGGTSSRSGAIFEAVRAYRAARSRRP